MTERLDIINSMLAVNGEAPVSDPGSNDPAAIQASNLLTRVDRKVQSRGWYFNTENFTLSPNTDGEVVVPQNALSVDPVDTTSQYVKRGTRLYDRKNNTYNIGEDVKCKVILLLDISEIPEPAASYIEAKAVREHYRNEDGDTQKVRDLRTDESEAYAFLQRDHLANEDINIRRSRLGLELLAETHGHYSPVIRGD